MRAEVVHPPRRRDARALTVALAVGAAASWVLLVRWRPAAMDMGTGMGARSNEAAFMAVWLAMVGAMMLPTIQPMVIAHAAMSGELARRARRLRTAAFVAPYGLVWAGAGIVALLLWRVGRAHPVVAGGLVVTAGLYQLGALKTRCLRWCRSPLGFLLRFGHDARSMTGSARLGARHAGVCLGCCAGLMVGLTGAGVMSVSWLGALALLMLLEKTHRSGLVLARASGAALVVLGVATTVVPLARATGEVAGVVALTLVVTGAVAAWVRAPRAVATPIA